ncbi:sigma factor [Agrococcus sp. Marseille-Q4369]|uniref:sigma factor n=1 Tax=Agrococcus sp. Marseille-Q4369 TaxID=2810513 RepID=UPI00201682F4|nr:sigma factor [Agrococcus sp. Marseille-Q4369]
MIDQAGLAIARAHRSEWSRVVAGLARRFGDLDLTEAAAGEAFLAAVERWPREGVRPNPGGWLTTTATRRAIDRLRRDGQRHGKHEAALMVFDGSPPEPTGAVAYDRALELTSNAGERAYLARRRDELDE